MKLFLTFFLLIAYSNICYGDEIESAVSAPSTVQKTDLPSSEKPSEEEPVAQDQEPVAIYLTWSEKPSESMIVAWITKSTTQELPKNLIEPAIRIQKVFTQTVEKEAGQASQKWEKKIATSRPFPENNPYLLHSVFIDSLEPDSLYLFEIEGTSSRHTFRTAPKTLFSSISFVIGGDSYQEEPLFQETNRLFAKRSPLFAVIGGDLAYATPSKLSAPEDCDRWMRWIKTWYETMQCQDGDTALPKRLIPLIVAIGNHEVKGRYNQRPSQAPFFYFLFRYPYIPKSYYTLRFNDYLSLYLLDSGHTEEIQETQKKWLEDQMKMDVRAWHKIAVYHVPAYPSVRYYRNPMSSKIRRHWVPIFDTWGLNFAFENHDHAYKRTFPLLNSNIHPKGVIYIGDGSWGARARVPKKAQQTSYLAKTVQAQQASVITISKELRKIEVLSSQGNEIDRYEELLDDSQPANRIEKSS